MSDPADRVQSVSMKNEKSKSAVKVNKPQKKSLKAEEEVVAVILSSIMGSIIASWEILPIEGKLSEDCVPCEISQGSHNYFDNIHESTIETRLSDNYLPNKFNASSAVNNSFLSKNETTGTSNNKELLFFDVSNENHDENKQNFARSGLSGETNETISPITSEERESPPQLLFKTLFENQKDKIFGWQFLDMDTQVSILFKQGNRFEGSLSSCRMHGLGKFFWADGSVYEGNFMNGEMTGEGCLQWSDQSYYEGEMLQGYRHGLGLFIQDSLFYTGYWRCGFRHGLGSMFYNHTNTQINYYNGEWSRDCKDGTGLRSYPSGAVYSGQWVEGLRQGLGTMVWTNNDVYRGNWEESKIHGYGEYTWDTFFNSQLVVPQENCYYGNWDSGIRHGNGTLETSLGVIVRGTWKNGEKHGPAEVICSNGSFVYGDNLFSEDCISSAVFDNSYDTDSLTDMTMQPTQLYKVPVNSANHNINLSFYSERLNEYVVECKRTGKPFKKISPRNDLYTNLRFSRKQNLSRKSTFEYSFIPNENRFQNEVEETQIRSIMLQYLSALKVIYFKYAELCCEVRPAFSSVLMRLMLWQLIRDCNLHTRGYSLADFDILIANNKATLVQGVHYPFERLQFWQFLHCIIEISWNLYGKLAVGTPSVKGVLASALHQLITMDILPSAGRYKGTALLRHRNLLSLDAVYWFYRGIGEPHSARIFLMNVMVPPDEGSVLPNIPDYPEHLLHGKNLIGVGGKLTYYPEDQPFIAHVKESTDNGHPYNLTCLSAIGILAVFKCILDICPSIEANSLIVNMDYKIVFLEFYEILLLCANLCVKKNSHEVKQDKSE